MDYEKYFWYYEVGIGNPKMNSQTIQVGNSLVTVIVSLIPKSLKSVGVIMSKRMVNPTQVSNWAQADLGVVFERISFVIPQCWHRAENTIKPGRKKPWNPPPWVRPQKYDKIPEKYSKNGQSMTRFVLNAKETPFFSCGMAPFRPLPKAKSPATCLSSTKKSTLPPESYTYYILPEYSM